MSESSVDSHSVVDDSDHSLTSNAFDLTVRDDLLLYIRSLDRLHRRLLKWLNALSHGWERGRFIRFRLYLRHYVRLLCKVCVARVRARERLLSSFPKPVVPVFDFFSVRDHHHEFRFSAADLQTIARALLPERVVAYRLVGGKRRKQCAADRLTALCVLLRHLATPERQDRQAVFFGRSTSWVSQIFHATLDIFYQKALFALRRWSQGYDALVPHFCNAMQEKSFGAFFAHALMDGSGIRVCRPVQQQDHFYNTGLESAHTLRIIALVRLDGVFERVLGPYPGSASDAAIVNSEGFERQLDLLHGHVHEQYNCDMRPTILSDAGFPESPNIWTPYKVMDRLNQRADEALFNRLLSHCRVPNEWSFGRIVNTFRTLTLQSVMMVEWTEPEKQYIVSMFLTNLVVCAEGSEIANYYGLQPPDLVDYLNKALSI